MQISHPPRNQRVDGFDWRNVSFIGPHAKQSAQLSTLQSTERFEVAHRVEAGEHYIEVSVGSSFKALYWDIPVRRFVGEPDWYEDVPEVLVTHDAGWLLEVIPELANGTAKLTSDDLVRMATEARDRASP